MKLRQRLGMEWLAVAFLASLIVIGLSYWENLSRFDNLIYDQWLGIAHVEPQPDILIIQIDEDSLTKYGKWPWSRDHHAQLFQRLAKARPKAIGFDILLSEPGDSESDSKLAAALAENDNIYLPLHFIFPGENGAEYDVKKPIAAFTAAATGLGHVNLEFDYDGLVRKASLCFGNRQTADHWPHLMEQLYRAANGHESAAFKRIDDCGEKRLLPYSDRGSFSSISYSAVASGEVPADFLADKIILIGATANGLGDQYTVPLGDGATMSGVEIMANLLSTLTADRFIVPLSFGQQLALSLLPMAILLIGFWFWRPRTTIFISLGLIAAILAISLILVNFQFWFAPGAALVGVIIVYPAWGWRRLQATSDFMDAELRNFGLAKVDIPIMEHEPGPVDIITGQAEALTHAIAHVRDLRRFIADALSNLPDPMFITDLEDKVKFVNKLAQAGIDDGAHDLALEHMLNRFVSAADLDDVKAYLARELKLDDHNYVEFTSLKGEVFAMRRAPVVSDEGDLRGFIHYLADITEVANAAREREEVLQLLSHDMRAPQAAILALLNSREPDDFTMRIAGHARRTLALADNFVGLAIINNNQFLGEDVLLSELVTEANDSLWPLAQARGIASHVDDQTGGAFVHGEPSSLYRSFVNLIDNAIKYSPDNGKIDVTMRVIDIDRQPYISITIADQGDGISAGIQEQLFGRFVSDDKAARSNIRGAGLGLNFVAKVIERHGGTITGENHREGGACFTVLLPIAPDPDE